jgi:glycosyltransferase involved in cell wall biosynthesis
MKIGVVIDRLNFGGVEKIAIEEVRALRSIGHDAHLVVLRREPIADTAFNDLLAAASIPLAYLDDCLPRWARLSARVPWFYFFSSFHLTYPVLLAARRRKWDYDILISHNTYTTLTALALRMTRGTPYVYFVWDPITYILVRAYPSGPLRLLRRLLLPLARVVDRRLILGSHCVLVAGSLHAQHLRTLARGRVEVRQVPPGTRPSTTLPSRRSDFFITATAWKEGKRLEDLIRVVAGLPAVRLKVVGQWVHERYLHRIRSLRESLEVTDRVELIGRVSETELIDLYRAARAVITMNEERGFGLATIEAAGHGCPFVAPRGSGAGDYFIHGAHGFLFDADQPCQVGEFIRALADDEALARTMGRQAWEEVCSGFSWEAHARQLLDVATNGSAPRDRNA